MDQVRNNLERSRRRTMLAAVLIAATLVVGILIGTVINGKVSAMKTFAFAGTNATPLAVPDPIPSSSSFQRNCQSRRASGGEHRHHASDRSPQEASRWPG